MAAASVYSRTLQKAAELIGGRKPLCRHLNVPQVELQRWIDDKATPPIGVFLKAVDLLIEETPAPPGSDAGDDGQTPSPRDCAAGDSSTSRY